MDVTQRLSIYSKCATQMLVSTKLTITCAHPAFGVFWCCFSCVSQTNWSFYLAIISTPLGHIQQIAHSWCQGVKIFILERLFLLLWCLCSICSLFFWGGVERCWVDRLDQPDWFPSGSKSTLFGQTSPSPSVPPCWQCRSEADEWLCRPTSACDSTTVGMTAPLAQKNVIRLQS